MMDLFMSCPVKGCPVQVEVSHEDPDASQSQLWNHLASRHPDLDTGLLLSHTQVVTAAGRSLNDAEIRAWMFAAADGQ